MDEEAKRPEAGAPDEGLRQTSAEEPAEPPETEERLTPQQKLFFLLVIMFALFLVFLKLFLEKKIAKAPEPITSGVEMENPYSEDFSGPVFSLPPAWSPGGGTEPESAPTYGPEPEP